MSGASERVEALRREMERVGVDVYLVPSADQHQSEYVPGVWQRRHWLSGFTGSAGDCAVGKDGAWQWADSRYWLQADAELDGSVWTTMRDGDDGVPNMASWLEQLEAGTVVGYDPRLHGLDQTERFEKALTQAGGALVSIDDNLVDRIWDGQPAIPSAPAAVWPDEYAGRSVADKLADVRDKLAGRRAGALVMTTLDAICWLFNVRGADVEFNPVLLSWAIVETDRATLYVHPEKVDDALRAHLDAAGVRLADYDAFADGVGALSGRVWVDNKHANRWVVDLLGDADCEVHSEQSPVMLLRAQKNATELAGMRAAHVRDAVAVCRFLHWLDSAWQGGELDEIAASDRLERFRAEGDRFKGLSFDTISGFGSNGAIVHYRSTPATSKRIDDSSLYLVDSGGQYLDGTTDITRTVHLGTPTATQREHYTRVLRGHLALRHATFSHKATGSNLDAFARAPLWEAGLDYGHGTGHGVGCYLSVHQGPHRISPVPNDVKLAPGMIVSNEPGLYLSGEYGIRIENLCVVTERISKEDAPMGPFHGFDDLTVVPYCRALVDTALLSATEIAQVDAYHAEVKAALAGLLPPEVQAWLDREAAPFSR